MLTPEKAHAYGRWLGTRYKAEPNLIWVLGGDRPAYTDEADYCPNWRAMAAEIDKGCGYRPFKAYHPSGGLSSSVWLEVENEYFTLMVILSLILPDKANRWANEPLSPSVDGTTSLRVNPLHAWLYFNRPFDTPSTGSG